MDWIAIVIYGGFSLATPAFGDMGIEVWSAPDAASCFSQMGKRHMAIIEEHPGARVCSFCDHVSEPVSFRRCEPKKVQQ